MDFSTFGELKDRIGLLGMGKPALVGIALIVAVVAVVAAGRLIGTATGSEFEVSKAVAEEQPAESSGQGAPSTMFVHVSGSVVAPGLYELEAGARVGDAVDAAGGFADDAANSSVNLARPLEDGEQIVVASSEAAAAGSQQAGGSAAPSKGASGQAGGLVNINTASAVELVALPGIGEATAAKIVADRDANGPFETVDDLKRVSGIGDKKFEALTGLICV